MRKINLPAPPQPSFVNSVPEPAPTQQHALLQPVAAKNGPEHQRELLPLNLDFLARVFRTSCWFGALLSVTLYAQTNSIPATKSFVVGIVLSLALFKSQIWFVNKLVRPRARQAAQKKGRDERLPLAVIVPAKYILLLLGIGWGVRSGFLAPQWFAMGATLVPFVVFAKTLGNLLHYYSRPLAEVYGTPGNERAANKA